MKLTWLIIDDTPMGTNQEICDFLCVRVIKPLFSLLEQANIRVAFVFSEAVLQFLCVEEKNLFAQLTAFVQSKRIELVIALSFPSHSLTQGMLSAHIAQKNAIYEHFFGVSSHVVLPFGLAFDARMIPLVKKHQIETLFINRASMSASIGIASHLGASISVLGIDGDLSRYSEEGSAKDFFTRFRDVAHEDAGVAVASTRLHHIGLMLGSYDRCWNKGLVKTMVAGMQQAQKWLKVVAPSTNKANISVFPVEGFFPLYADHALSWMAQYAHAPELMLLWNQLTLLPQMITEEECTKLVPAQVGHLFLSHPHGWLEDMQLRHNIWNVIGDIMEDQIVPAIQQEDRDCDGYDEVYIRSGMGDTICLPAVGGSLGMMLIPSVGNLINVLSRRYQPWHSTIAPDPSLPVLEGDVFVTHGLSPQNPYFYNRWGYDKHHRGIFSDILFDNNVELYKLRRGRARVLYDCTTTNYRILSMEETQEGVVLDLETQISVPTSKGMRSLTIQKEYWFSFDSSRVDVTYIVENNSLEPIESTLGVEINVGLGNVLRPNTVFQVFPNPFAGSFLQAGHRKTSTYMEWLFEEGTFRVSTSENVPVFFYPVEVPDAQPRYIDMGYQGHCAMLAVSLDLWAGEQKSWKISSVWERA